MLALLALLVVGATEDAYSINTYRCEPGGWRVTTPAGWVLTPRQTDDPRTHVEVNATKAGVKGNVVIAWTKGDTLAARKAFYENTGDTPGVVHFSRKPTIEKQKGKKGKQGEKGDEPQRLRVELDVDGGAGGRTYAVAVAGPRPDIVVEVRVPAAGPSADYAELKATVDAFAAAVVFETPADKPWAHKKNVELLTGKLCSSKTRALTFDGAGRVLVDPGAVRSWYDLFDDDAKVAVPGTGPALVEVACKASQRAADGHVVELRCGAVAWRADLCR